MKILEKLQKRLQEGKKDNKGFSLVELIIVIAIMAILVGIVGTQVIPYIESSRKAKDIQVLSGFLTDAMSAYSSSAADLNGNAVYTITVTIGAGGAATVGVTGTPADTAGSDKLRAKFDEYNNLETVTAGASGNTYAAGSQTIKLASKPGGALTSFTITCNDPTKGHLFILEATGFDDITSN